MKSQYSVNPLPNSPRAVRRNSPGRSTLEAPGAGRQIQAPKSQTRRHSGAGLNGASALSTGLQIDEIWEEQRGATWVTCIRGMQDGSRIGLVIDARGHAFEDKRTASRS